MNKYDLMIDGKPTTKIYTQADLDAAVLAEREACAKLSEKHGDGPQNGHYMAAAIRARATREPNQ